MRFTHFSVKNFKGIEEVRLDLLAAPRSKVHTLIGLNESGKTTLLEAINLLSYRDNLNALGVPGYVDYDPHDLIPISKRSNFNGKITIEAGVTMESGDLRAIASKAKKEAGIDVHQISGSFTIETVYEFKSSKVISDTPHDLWSVEVRGKTAGQRRPSLLDGESWEKVTDLMRPLLPIVVYFPNFLFDFPDKIYLENPPSDSEKHEFFKAVFQDVLDAVGEHTNLTEHVLARARSAEDPDKKSLESVLLNMGAHITRTVFTNWDKIFRRPGSRKTEGRKEIQVSMNREGPAGPWYLQLRLKDGTELYSISERSLGFRWFFTYLLLTQYRGFRRGGSRNVVFLLDEPASNLHPSAQTQLLNSFQNLPEGCQIVYTTHSHHMINPEWLEGAYVVKNAGLEYKDEEQDYSSRRTVITLHKYRTFASTHPDQTTYFQPVLDVLNYSPHYLENIPDVVMVEGKNDFYTISWLQNNLRSADRLKLLPGTGAGTLDSVIRLYIAWGRNFIVLLDSDREGISQKARYETLFGEMLNGRLFLLGELEPTLANHELEDIISPGERLSIQQKAYPSTTAYHKTHFNRALQERTLVGDSTDPLSKETTQRVRGLLDSIKARLISAKQMGMPF